MKAKNDTLPAEVNTTQLLKSLVGKLAGLFSWEENDAQHRSNTPCRHPGCAALVPYGQKYCEVHKPQHPEEVRTVSGRGYGKAWQKARQRYLEAHPLCVEYMKEGKYVKATDVDYIIPHRGDRKLFRDENKWQALCHSHHSIKTRNKNQNALPSEGCISP